MKIEENQYTLHFKFLVLQDLIKQNILDIDENVMNCIQAISEEYKNKLDLYEPDKSKELYGLIIEKIKNNDVEYLINKLKGASYD